MAWTRSPAVCEGLARPASTDSCAAAPQVAYLGWGFLPCGGIWDQVYYVYLKFKFLSGPNMDSD
jgi:hypothetical protein